jgi:heterodisulfide reductase subunit A
MSDKEEIRIGVYTCYCGGNISDTVDCEKVARTLLKLPNVVVSRTNMSMCSDIGQAMIEEDIREHGVNRVVVGACAPSLHEQTFRGALRRAGLNRYLYYHIGIREQASWVHKDDPEGATEKVVRLMSAGIAKARLLEPLNPIQLDAEQHALVIGGGIAGLRAAWDIARRGIKVTLIEKSPFLGGHAAQLETVFPTGQMARDILHDIIEKVLSHPNITVLTRAEVAKVQGYVGDYHVQIKQQARGVTGEPSTAEAMMEACPVEVPDEFNLGLTTRKAIYRAYPGCYPAAPAIDWQTCTLCGKCQEIDGESISLDNTSETFEVTVGAIVVATGFRLYEPRDGEFGYGQFPEVMSLAQLIRLLALTEKGRELEWNGHHVRNIALVHCVGSRQVPGVHEPQPDGEVNNYCSRVCCTATLHIANELRARFSQANIYDIYEDIRTYGRGHEDYYIQASEDMVRFLRFHADEPPEVVVDPQGVLLVKVKDHLTWGEEIDVPADLVVLATGIMPSQSLARNRSLPARGSSKTASRRDSSPRRDFGRDRTGPDEYPGKLRRSFGGSRQGGRAAGPGISRSGAIRSSCRSRTVRWNR